MNISHFGILTPVGPGEKELARLRDLLSSLFYYEPMCRVIVLIDDAPNNRHLERVVAELKPEHNTECIVKVFVNPRRSKGIGWTGGMTVGVLLGSLWMANHTDVEFVVRLDTDSLVIAPFATTLNALLIACPNVGQVGTFRRHVDGRNRALSLSELPTLLKLAALRRRAGGGMHPQTTLWGRARRRAKVIRLAQRNGFTLGESVQGGGYAMSRTFLDQIAQLPLVQDSWLFQDTTVPEDVMMTIICYACGLVTEDFNRDGQVFGVAWSALPDSPENLVTRGYSVIHPVKDNSNLKESEIREFFKNLRSKF